MKQKRMFPALLGLTLILSMSACTKEKMEENEEEVITTLKLTFTPVAGGSGGSKVFQFDDPDGPGGTAPTLDEINLQAGTSYNVTIQLLNTTKSPAEDITVEVKEEADAHRLYYVPSAGSNLTITNLDNDNNGAPLGINSTWTAGASATGKVKVTLRHYPGNPPNKDQSDAVDSPKSSTDVEVEFNTRIQ